MVNVEIVYVPIDKSVIQLKCVLAPGSTVGDAISQSGLLKSHPEIQDFALGIFAKKVTADTILRTGDRIEIYRPLVNDPKEKRRQRAKAK